MRDKQLNSNSSSLYRRWFVPAIVISAGLLVVVGILVHRSTVLTPATQSPIPAATSVTPAVTGSPEGDTPVIPQTTDQRLIYLIEEEKLAYDIYTAMYAQWGSNVFGSIRESEATHQSRVLTLLQARNIDDPRTGVAGTFQNAALQQFYDQLLTKGKLSQVDAYEVGVMIEERDIQDLTEALAYTTDAAVIAVLTDLRNGSENHLRAFNRQLERIR